MSVKATLEAWLHFIATKFHHNDLPEPPLPGQGSLVLTPVNAAAPTVHLDSGAVSDAAATLMDARVNAPQSSGSTTSAAAIPPKQVPFPVHLCPDKTYHCLTEAELDENLRAAWTNRIAWPVRPVGGFQGSPPPGYPNPEGLSNEALFERTGYAMSGLESAYKKFSVTPHQRLTQLGVDINNPPDLNEQHR